MPEKTNPDGTLPLHGRTDPAGDPRRRHEPVAAAQQVPTTSEDSSAARTTVPADPAGGRPAPEAASHIGQRIGSYTILGIIGEGGMGAVYRAQQDKPRQMVALKVIGGGLPSPREMRRFEFESEVLGHLQHVGIARIYQAGLFDTRTGPQPYFAMELIDGQPLTAFANQAALGTRKRLELIARVADAVQHAHSHGIVHLDLKPGNILVTADGQPKVVDFGLARLAPGQQPHALAELHMSTTIGGTPAYMSPEQAAGDPRDIDARSDVYSLGVVAYQLLTGRFPYPSLNSSDRPLWPNEVVRIVREEEATRLARATRWDGSSARAFAGDVEAVVHKALEKDKDRRYQTAAALAADIRRHLNNEPVAARPPSAAYQLRKFARRNTALVGGLVATFVVLVTGVITTGIALGRANQQRAAALKAAHETSVISGFLERMLRSADPGMANPPAGWGRDVRMADVIRQVSVDRDVDLSAEPTLEARVAKTLALTLRGLGLYDDAEQLLLAVGARISFPGAAVSKCDLAVLDLVRAQIKQDLQRSEEAARIALETIPIFRAELPERSLELADALILYSDAISQSTSTAASLDEADRCLDEAHELLRRIGQERSEQAVSAAAAKATTAYRRRDFVRAAAALERAHDLSLDVLGPGHPHSLTIVANLAQVYSDLGRSEESDRLWTNAVAGVRHRLGSDHPLLATCEHYQASRLITRGARGEAAAILADALRIRAKAFGEDSLLTADAHYVLGQCAATYEEGAKHSRAALAVYRRHYGLESYARRLATLNLALALYWGDGDKREAADLCRELVDYCDDHPGACAVEDRLDYLGQLCGTLAVLDDTSTDAKELHQRLLTLCRESLGPGDGRTLLAQQRLAALLMARNELDEAGPLLLDLAQRVLDGGNWHAYERAVMVPDAADRVIGNWREMYTIAGRNENEMGREIRPRAAECIARLYEALHAAAPDGGYDVSAKEWRSKLVEEQAGTQPAARERSE